MNDCSSTNTQIADQSRVLQYRGTRNAPCEKICILKSLENAKHCALALSSWDCVILNLFFIEAVHKNDSYCS